MPRELVLWLEDVGRDLVNFVGGKSANLGEMCRARMPVPPGFAITTLAYDRFLAETGLGQEISRYATKLTEGPEEYQHYEEVGRALRSAIEAGQMPKDVAQAIISNYSVLCQRCGTTDVPVAVRSSGVSEDMASASFAGQFDSYLNVKGKGELLRHVQRCWASLFTTRAIAYRRKVGLPAGGGSISVVVMKMVDARCAGIAFTVDPAHCDHSKIVIEGNWGLGESVVGGMATPDTYLVDKDTLKISDVRVGQKTVQIVPTGKGTQQEEIPPHKQNERCLSDEEVERLAELAKALGSHYGIPQDIEWAIDAELPFPQNVFLLQTRPVTALGAKQDTTDQVIDMMLDIMRRSG